MKDTYFAEVILQDGNYFQFMLEAVNYGAAEFVVMALCHNNGYKKVQIFNMSEWATMPIRSETQ